MSSYTKEFLQAYKRFEQACGGNVMAYEDGHSECAKQLQICRLLRNYASHHADMDKIFPIPKQTVDYMRDMTARISGTAQDVMTRITPVELTDTKEHGIRRLCTVWKIHGFPFMPVVDGDRKIKGLIGLEHIIKYMTDKDQSGTIEDFKLIKADTVSPDDPAPENGFTVVVRSGYFCGVIWRGSNEKDIYRPG